MLYGLTKGRWFKWLLARYWIVCLVLVAFVNASAGQTIIVGSSEPRVRSADRCLLITIDGLRWQEVFGGADARLMDRNSGVEDPDALIRRYQREEAREARKVLMPFLWSVIARDGQIWGNPALGSEVRVTNSMHFSYPGYNEILSGFADPQIDSNDKVPNANQTVLEWLNRKEGFRGKVAAFASWDVFPFIINTGRSGVFVNAGWELLPEYGGESAAAQMNLIAGRLPHYWKSVRYDAFTLQGALDCLQFEKPKVLFVAFGETDDWAHSGRYDLYLDAATKTDAAIAELWNTIQALEEYRDRTVLLITTDHGRGEGREDWKSHSAKIDGCDRIWIAAMGPGVNPLGERSGVTATQAQMAPTVAHMIGMDFKASDTRIAEPIDLNADGE